MQCRRENLRWEKNHQYARNERVCIVFIQMRHTFTDWDEVRLRKRRAWNEPYRTWCGGNGDARARMSEIGDREFTENTFLFRNKWLRWGTVDPKIEETTFFLPKIFAIRHWPFLGQYFFFRWKKLELIALSITTRLLLVYRISLRDATKIMQDTALSIQFRNKYFSFHSFISLILFSKLLQSIDGKIECQHVSNLRDRNEEITTIVCVYTIEICSAGRNVFTPSSARREPSMEREGLHFY